MSDVIAAIERAGMETLRVDNVRFAGFWVRTFAGFIDFLFILLVMVICILFDLYVTKGELGAMTQYRTFGQEILEKQTTPIEGGTREFLRYIEKREDSSGRQGTAMITIEEEKVNGTTWNYATEEWVEVHPDFGGKYALFFDIAFMLFIVSYFTLMWSSRYQATLGQRAMDLRVSDRNFVRLSIPHAFGRLCASFLSSVTLVGYWMIGWNKRKLGLHDIIAKTYVHYNPEKFENKPSLPDYPELVL